MNPVPNVVIGIPTFKRAAGLTRLLASIEEIRTTCNVSVLVGDNEGHGGAGLGVVAELEARGYRFPIEAIPVPERGISPVRNALMKRALHERKADALVMVDDDERVEPDWLQALVDVWQEGGFDVVGGAVLPEFEAPPPTWVKGLHLYWRRIHGRGAIDMVQSTCSVLIARSVAERYGDQWFDAAFALTGGGDREYFMRLKMRGATFGFAPAAISHESFSSSRTTVRWALQRAYRIGSGDARMFLLHQAKGRGVAREMAKLCAAMLAGACAVLVCSPIPRLRMKYAVLLSRQMGKLNGYFGKPPEVYRQVHGS